MKLSTKLIGGFSIVAGITLITGMIGYTGAAKSQASIEAIAEVRMPGLSNVLTIREKGEMVSSQLQSLVIPGRSFEARHAVYDAIPELRNESLAAWDVYASLPKTEEEAQLWKAFVPAWDAWVGANDEFMKYARAFDEQGIADPNELAKLIQQFTKDHWVAVVRVQDLVNKGKSFKGGDDHTACNAGKWMPSFESSNPEFQNLITSCAHPHEAFHQAIGEIQKAMARGKPEEASAIYDSEMLASMETVFGFFDQMQRVADQAVVQMREAEKQMEGPVEQAKNHALTLLDRIADENRKIAAEQAAAADRTAEFSKWATLLAVIVGSILSLTLGILIARGISRPITRIIQVLSRTALQSSSAAGQVASSSQSLAQSSSEQAASLEESSASLEEMSGMTRNNAENATHATRLAGETRAAAEAGSSQMEQMAEAMDRINTSSNDISAIIKTIDEIAFQTNILALNAAVEAARAGDAGAGFAVVADEVRNLAGRSAQAAKDTAKMIEEAVSRSAEGVELSGRVGSGLQTIVQKIREVDERISDIEKASREQEQGIGQINAAVTQMDQTTQANAASAEETASASEELNRQTRRLNKAIGELSYLVYGNATEFDVDSDRKAKAEPGPRSRNTGNGLHPAKKNDRVASESGAFFSGSGWDREEETVSEFAGTRD